MKTQIIELEPEGYLAQIKVSRLGKWKTLSEDGCPIPWRKDILTDGQCEKLDEAKRRISLALGIHGKGTVVG